MSNRLADQLDPFFDSEEWAATLVGRVRDTDDQFVEQPGGTFYDVEVTAGERVERSRYNRAAYDAFVPLPYVATSIPIDP